MGQEEPKTSAGDDPKRRDKPKRWDKPKPAGDELEPAEDTTTRVPADPLVRLLAGAMVIVGVVFIAGMWDKSEDFFHPRLSMVDALAGLFIGASLVDRLVTFIPPVRARKKANERAADLDALRFGYGAILGGIFVSVTELHGAGPLTTNDAAGLADGVDRGIAALAIAGGTVGLARLLDGLNPKDKTSATDKTIAEAPDPEDKTKLRLHAVDKAGTAVAADGNEVVPPPTPFAYVIGLVGLLAAALLAILGADNKEGSMLIGTEEGAEGVVVRFGLVILAAGLVEQIVERSFAAGRTGADKPLIAGAAAVVLGVAAAVILKIYLLHNVGFFGLSRPEIGLSEQQVFEKVLSAGPASERWLDTFATGLIIAGGTKVVHDLGSRLRKTPKPKTDAAAGAGGGGAPGA